MSAINNVSLPSSYPLSRLGAEFVSSFVVTYLIYEIFKRVVKGAFDNSEEKTAALSVFAAIFVFASGQAAQVWTASHSHSAEQITILVFFSAAGALTAISLAFVVYLFKKISPDSTDKNALSTQGSQFVTQLYAQKSPPPQNSVTSMHRDSEYADLINALERQNGAFLVGATGSGKSNFIQKLVQNPPQAFKEIIQLDIAAFTSDTKYLGMFESHVRDLSLRMKANNSILIIEGSRLLIPTKQEDVFNFAGHLDTLVDDPAFRVIITLTPSEYDKIKDRCPKLAKYLAEIGLKPLTFPQSTQILQTLKPGIEKKLSCTIDDDAIAILSDYHSYLKGSLPGSLVTFFHSLPIKEREKITVEIIQEELAASLNIDKKWFFSPSEKITEAKEALKQTLFGQDMQIDKICDTIRLRKMGLSPNPEGPLGKFLVLGPTGVGKTYFARLLAAELFNGNFIHIDMQHLIDMDELVKLTAHGGSFAQLNNRPFTVVLLDEIEKAPIQAQDALLTILQQGQLVDKAGYLTRFDHAVILMTTNANPSNYLEKFSSAFISRLDVVPFKQLGLSELKLIVAGRIKKIRDVCQKKYQSTLEVGQEINDHLAHELSNVHDARQIDRLIESRFSLPLSYALKSRQSLVASIKEKDITFKEGRDK